MAEAESHRCEGLEALKSGRFPRAILAFSRVAELRPDHADSHFLLGQAYEATHCAAAAEDAYRLALRLRPGFAEARLRLMALLLLEGREAEAIADCEDPAAHERDQSSRWRALGQACVNAGRAGEGERAFRKALALDANDAGGWLGLGQLLEQQSRREQAEQAYRQALRSSPDDEKAQLSLARLLFGQGCLEESLRIFEDLTRSRPRNAEAHYGHGNVLLRLRRPREALAAYRSARELFPQLAKGYFAEASPLLMMGEFEAGWEAYEWRLRMPGGGWKLPNVLDRLWDGGPLAGKRLLVHAEQGFGDTLQFVRYLAELRRREGPDACIVFLCEPELARLLATVPGCEEIHAPRRVGSIDYDYQIPLLSLPHRLRSTLASIPSDVPYLRLPEDASVTVPCPEGVRLKVAFAWAGRPTHSDDRMRSCPPDHFAGLFDLPGIQFYSLQVGERAEEIAPYLDLPNVSAMTEKPADFADTMAVIDRMDLVISVDTSIVHLAGAYGKPVWTLLAFGGEWRWLLDREDSPWYPTMRLFRQASPGDWGAVFEKVRRALQAILAEPARIRNFSPPMPAVVGKSSGPIPAQALSAATLRFRDYTLENVYLRVTERQRGEIVRFWREQGAVPDPAERARRSDEVVLMVRNAAGELAGLSTVELKREADGRIFFAYRMFLRRKDRVPYLMWAVTDGTFDSLKRLPHPRASAAGMMIVTENPKLMRPGMKRDFQRHGYAYQGKTDQGLDIWVSNFGD